MYRFWGNIFITYKRKIQIYIYIYIYAYITRGRGIKSCISPTQKLRIKSLQIHVLVYVRICFAVGSPGKGDKVLYFPDTEAMNQIIGKTHIYI